MKFQMVIESDTLSFRRKFKRKKCLIGRNEGDLKLSADMYCSSKHAIIEDRFDGTLWIRDLNSRNGIYVNGRRVNTHQLKVGDRIRIGSTNISISDDLIIDTSSFENMRMIEFD